MNQAERQLFHDIVGHVWRLKANKHNYIALSVEDTSTKHAARVYGMCLETGQHDVFLDYYHVFTQNLTGDDGRWDRISFGSLSVGT